MNSMLEGVIPIGSLIVAALSLILSSLRGHREEVKQDQRVTDRLDRIKEITSDTRDTIKEMSIKLDDHATRITRSEEKLDTMNSRLAKVENELSYLQKGKAYE